VPIPSPIVEVIVVINALAVTTTLVFLAAEVPSPSPMDALPAWAMLREDAYIAYLRKQFPVCAGLFAQAARGADAADAADLWYGAATCAARAADPDQAFRELGSAADTGYRNPAAASSDLDLQSLRGDPRWARWLAQVRRQEGTFLETVNREVYQLYEEDQADRPSDPNVVVDWKAISERDRGRRDAVTELFYAGKLTTAEDLYCGAMILQHGQAAGDFSLAHELSLRAVAVEPDRRAWRWLAAATLDRFLMTIGEPQHYGTQFSRARNGPWVLYPIDPATTDGERARWWVPPIAVLRRRAEALNSGESAASTKPTG
jgi:hypothetical protein